MTEKTDLSDEDVAAVIELARKIYDPLIPLVNDENRPEHVVAALTLVRDSVAAQTGVDVTITELPKGM